MADGSDAIADWPLLNALVNTASGASWVSIHHGGGVGIGRSIHAGQVCVADGTELAGAEAGAGADQRPGHGRDPARRRRLRPGRPRSPPSAASGCRWRRRAVRPAGAMTFAELWDSLLPLGRDAATGGYRRYSFTEADPACRDWFVEHGRHSAGCARRRDRNGNLWAWWDVPAASAGRPRRSSPGSHLDSVPDGGAFDGPLGVVSAFAAIDELRGAGFAPGPAGRGGRVLRGGGRPVRRGLPGQPAADRRAGAAGRAGAARRRRRDPGRGDDGGRARPGRLGRDEELLAGIAAFVELHIEQGSALDGLGAAVGIAEGIWPHGRWRLDFTGRADHAGTTRLDDRRDPMLPYAAAVLAARQAAAGTRRAGHVRQGQRRAGRRQRHQLGRARLAGRAGPGRGGA